uniref:SOUL heme-binding protein n=1 Tax=Chromera velia CCMP2878 TaxID=1169474 RepID=A0A0G4HDR8_9ALVE|eukprot:Cvel_26481.t1-p1 / transcript=Cvel_26481.t1 / gene=Cvel_26481 / organism=Chromera_velia_CCMP2878 / gene_product=Heme-binding-like protein At3g10130, chloroplastic, putative / transcript_product=Heme-binding-like protein At3g10130, chloroplastic, putative / location=Cvel_scaffold3155:8774-11534(-) / protein_length=222 / sequence_SO=supercontig / SO=protein_coding / is_pseudo=false
MGSVFGRITEETPPFVSLKTGENGRYEIRKYEPQIRAVCEYPVTSEDPFAEAGKGFRPLAGYIFGGNKGSSAGGDGERKEKESIAMTAPVVVEDSGDRGEGGAGTKPKTKTRKMAFIMPKSKYTSKESLPIPTNATEVKIEEHPEEVVAVITFSWNFSLAAKEAKTKELLEFLREDFGDRIQTADPNESAKFYGYNPPWTLPWCRKNELVLPITRLPEELAG